MIFGGKSRFPILNSPQADQERFLFYLEKQLKYEGAPQVVRHGDLVIFSGILFTFMHIRSFLAGGGRGFIRVTIEDQNLNVTYRLSFFGMLILLMVGSLLLVFGFIFNILPVESILYMFLAFYFFIGFNILIPLVSFSLFIEKTFDSFMKE